MDYAYHHSVNVRQNFDILVEVLFFILIPLTKSFVLLNCPKFGANLSQLVMMTHGMAEMNGTLANEALYDTTSSYVMCKMVKLLFRYFPYTAIPVHFLSCFISDDPPLSFSLAIPSILLFTSVLPFPEAYLDTGHLGRISWHI